MSLFTHDYEDETLNSPTATSSTTGAAFTIDNDAAMGMGSSFGYNIDPGTAGPAGGLQSQYSLAAITKASGVSLRCEFNFDNFTHPTAPSGAFNLCGLLIASAFWPINFQGRRNAAGDGFEVRLNYESSGGPAFSSWVACVAGKNTFEAHFEYETGTDGGAVWWLNDVQQDDFRTWDSSGESVATPTLYVGIGSNDGAVTSGTVYIDNVEINNDKLFIGATAEPAASGGGGGGVTAVMFKDE